MVKWKREKVQDHKFDFVDVEQFEKKGFANKIKYSYVFLIVLKSVLVYLADLYNAGGLILSDLGDKWGGITPKIPFNISRWVFLGSVVVSFILLFIEVRKAKRIIASGDISYAFTSTVATRYYTLTSYAHWCFFQEIINQQRTQDKIAFFVFFAFKGWKRLIFCDGPRQVINAITLYTLFHDRRFTTDISKYGSIFTQASMGVMIFTVSIFFFSACLLLVAFIMYLPLLCTIRGNLKEYCCLLIDKRIAEILKIQREKRLKNNATKPSVDRNRFNGVAPTLPVLDDGMANNKVPAPYTKPPVPYTKTPPPTHPPMHPNHDPYYNGIPLPNDPNIMGRPNVPRNQPPRHFPPQGDPYMGSDLPYDGNPYPEVPYHASPYSPQNKYPYQQQPDYVVGPNDPYYDDYYDDEPYSQPLQPQNTQFIPNNVIQNDSNLPVRYQQNPSSRPYNNHPNSRWS